MKKNEIKSIVNYGNSRIARAMREIEVSCKTYKLKEKMFTDYEKLHKSVAIISENLAPNIQVEDVLDNLSNTAILLLKVGVTLDGLKKEKDFISVEKLNLEPETILEFVGVDYMEQIFTPMQEIKLNILDSGGIVNYAHRVPIDSLHYSLNDLENTTFTSKYYNDATELIEVLKSCIKIKEELNSLMKFENKLLGCE